MERKMQQIKTHTKKKEHKETMIEHYNYYILNRGPWNVHHLQH